MGECLGTVDIPFLADGNIHEEKVIHIFKKVGCIIYLKIIEKCHQIMKTDRVIVKFHWRKDCPQVLSVKKNFKKLKVENIDRLLSY